MTIYDAILELQAIPDCCELALTDNEMEARREAINMAISVLKEEEKRKEQDETN